MYEEMTEAQVLALLVKVGVFLKDGHFAYTSGKHGSAYVNKDALYPHTQETNQLCQDIARKFRLPSYSIETVVGPAVGGIILSQWTAYHLTQFATREMTAVFAEKEVVTIDDPAGKGRVCYAETGQFVFTRGYGELVRDKNVLVIEDILTTGGSAKKVVDTVRRAGGTVVAVAALCNRGEVSKAEVGDPPHLFALANIQLDAWEPAECPLCADGVPINMDVGKGRKLVASQK